MKVMHLDEILLDRIAEVARGDAHRVLVRRQRVVLALYDDVAKQAILLVRLLQKLSKHGAPPLGDLLAADVGQLGLDALLREIR